MTGKSIKTFKRFALVDDDADDAELFAEALAAINPGISCDYASNGSVLLERIQKHDSAIPDIIFLDINMPEMNGWDSLAQLKKHAHLRNVPVVMYSTSSAYRDMEAAKKLGANFFYTKPESFRELKSFLESLIANPGQYNIIT